MTVCMKIAMPVLLDLLHQKREFVMHDSMLMFGDTSQNIYVPLFTKFQQDSLFFSVLNDIRFLLHVYKSRHKRVWRMITVMSLVKHNLS